MRTCYGYGMVLRLSWCVCVLLMLDINDLDVPVFPLTSFTSESMLICSRFYSRSCPYRSIPESTKCKQKTKDNPRITLN